MEGSSNFSRGLWISTHDGGITWQPGNAPVGGLVSAAGGELWLVGGVQDSSLYESKDGGATWQAASLPLTSTAEQTPALGPVYSTGRGNGVVLTATMSAAGQNNAVVTVLSGDASGSQWNWTAGPAITLGGDYGAGTPVTTSIADGVLWVLSSSQIAQVALSTGHVSVVSPDGLPQATAVALHAQSATQAWLSYSVESCSATKSGCATVSGLVSTADGGHLWSPAQNPIR